MTTGYPQIDWEPIHGNTSQYTMKRECGTCANEIKDWDRASHVKQQIRDRVPEEKRTDYYCDLERKADEKKRKFECKWKKKRDK